MTGVWLASEEDAMAVTKLIAAFRDWWGRDAPSDGEIAGSVRRLLADPDTDFLLAAPDPDAPACGIVQLRYRHSVWTGTPDCTLEDLFVREDSRRAGYGRRLVGAAVERARERGCARMELDVNEANPPALALYGALGFSASADPTAGRRLLMRREL